MLKQKWLIYTFLTICIGCASLYLGVNIHNAGAHGTPADPITYVASAPRTGLTLDLNFGNNSDGATPTVYDTSGFNRNATSTAGTGAPTCKDRSCYFDGGDIMTANVTNVFNYATASLAIKFKPSFAVSDNVGDYLFDTSTGGRFNVFKAANASNNILQIQFSNAILFSIAQSAYEPYWWTNRDNVLIIAGTTGATNAYLNGYLIGTAAGGWSVVNPSNLIFGSRNDGAFKFTTGTISFFKVWNRILTSAEIASLSVDRTNYISAPSRTGLVGWWTMDANDISGTSYLDKSGFNNTATSTATVNRKGKIGQAVNFYAINSGLDVAQSSRYDLIGGGTVSFWMNQTAIPTGETRNIIANGTASNGTTTGYGWAIRYRGDISYLYFNQSTTAGASGISSCSIPFTTAVANTWYHITFTLNNSSPCTCPTVYVNGVSVSATQQAACAGTAVVGGDIRFGKSMVGNNAYQGYLDDVRIYNRVLSAQEASNLYKSAKLNFVK